MARSSSSLMSRRPATSRYGPRSWSEPKPLFHLFPTEPYSSTASRAASRSMRSSRSFSSARSSSETSAATSRPRRSRLSLTLCVVAASLLGLDVGYCVTFPQARVLLACECPGPFIKLLIRGRCGRGREDDGPLGGYRGDTKGISTDQSHLMAAQRG